MKLPPWLWRVFASRRLKITLICSPFILMIGLVAFYGIVNWWAVRQFERSVASFKSEGLLLTMEEAFGPVGTQEQDVLEHPAMAAELAAPKGLRLDSFTKLNLPGLSRSSAAWKSIPDLRKRDDVRNWTDPARPGEDEKVVAGDILALIKARSDQFDEIRPALDRTDIAWFRQGRQPEEYGEPAIFQFQRIADFARDRAILHLAMGNTLAAAEDVGALWEIQCALCRKPCAVSFVRAEFIERQIFEVVWEGIDRGAWSDTQLGRFQSIFAEPDFQKAAVASLTGELSYSSAAMRSAVRNPSSFKKYSAGWRGICDGLWNASRDRDGKMAANALKAGWQAYRPWGMDLRAATEEYAAMRSEGFYVGSKRRELFTVDDFHRFKAMMWSDLFINQLCGISYHTLTASTHRSLLTCGIALERYRLKYGTNPENLEALVPEFLPGIPKDVCDGAALRYRRLSDGGVHVWSLWPSGKDEGGLPKRRAIRGGNQIWSTGIVPGLTEETYKNPY